MKLVISANVALHDTVSQKISEFACKRRISIHFLKSRQPRDKLSH